MDVLQFVEKMQFMNSMLWIVHFSCNQERRAGGRVGVERGE